MRLQHGKNAQRLIWCHINVFLTNKAAGALQDALCVLTTGIILFFIQHDASLPKAELIFSKNVSYPMLCIFSTIVVSGKRGKRWPLEDYLEENSEHGYT